MITKKVNYNEYALVLNAGSATLKWALFERDGLKEVGRGVVERIGERNSFAEWRLHGKLGVKHIAILNQRQAVGYVVKMLAWHHLLEQVKLVGHRLVHGGSRFNIPQALTAAGLKGLARLKDLAPLHNPVELEVVKVARQILPKVKQVAVFDTAWFARLPKESSTYALPYKLVEKYDLRRYGFHGLSHSYVVQEAARRLGKPLEQLNLISCHLGSGSSVAAVRGGRPIDISLGFTPLEGLVMGTRAGDLDPGLVLYLLRQRGLNATKLEKLLNHESGLKGIAGVADMREVLVRAGYEVLGFKTPSKVSSPERRRAQLALKVFLHRLRKYIGAYAAILGRVDAIVFTGGIGERNEVIRNLTMQDLPTLKTVLVMAIPTNEELAIAREITKSV